jgi:predicted nucleic-acid-binding protein
MRLIDANIVLRYVLNDHPGLSQEAKNLIDNNDVEIPIEALCEVAFVLKSVYNITRSAISEKLVTFFEKTQCGLPHRDAVLRGIEYYAVTNLDFVDCIFAGYAEIENAIVETFDDGLRRLLNRLNPLL